MGATPEIVALTTARDASEHARALEAAADERSLAKRVVPALLFAAVLLAVLLLGRAGVFEAGSMVGFGAALLVAVTLGAEVYHLRRRVKALTYLVLERERQTLEP